MQEGSGRCLGSAAAMAALRDAQPLGG
jgi:hypothetical protein